MSGRTASFWLRAGETTLALLAMLVPLGFLLHSYEASYFKTTLLQAGALVLVACWLIKGFTRGRWQAPARAVPVLLAVLLLGGWTLARAAFSPSPAAAVPAAVRILLGLSLFSVALLECGGARSAGRFGSWLLGAGWIASLYGVAQRCGIDPLPWKGAFGGAAFSTLGSPEAFAVFASVCAPLALARLTDPERTDEGRCADGALLVLLGAAVAASGSAAGAAAFAAASGFSAVMLPVFLPARATLRVAAAGLLLGAVTACAALALPRTDAAAAVSTRELWRSTLRMVERHPVAGVGPGRFALVLEETAPRGDDTARPDLGPGPLAELAAELGLVGFLLCGVIFAGALIEALRARRRLIQRGALTESAQLAGAVSALAVLLTAGQMLGTSHNSASWLCWPLAGLALGLALMTARGPVAVMPVAFTDAARRRFAAASIVGLAVALALPLRWQAADIRLGEAVAAARAGHYADAALYAQQSDVWGARRRLEARYVAGSALLAANRPEEAMDLFAALELEAPVFAQLQLQIGRVQLKMGRPQEAYDYFTRQRELTPTLVPALEGLAVAAKETGRLDEARKALLAAISLRPDDAVLYLSLADIYKRENNKAEARALEQRVKKLRREEKPSRSGRDG